MTDSLPYRDVTDEARSRDWLAQIAAALGEPEAVFFDSGVARKIRETEEMLRLWNGLTKEADRRKLLALARSLAAERA